MYLSRTKKRILAGIAGGVLTLSAVFGVLRINTSRIEMKEIKDEVGTGLRSSISSYINQSGYELSDDEYTALLASVVETVVNELDNSNLTAEKVEELGTLAGEMALEQLNDANLSNPQKERIKEVAKSLTTIMVSTVYGNAGKTESDTLNDINVSSVTNVMADTQKSENNVVSELSQFNKKMTEINEIINISDINRLYEDGMKLKVLLDAIDYKKGLSDTGVNSIDEALGSVEKIYSDIPALTKYAYFMNLNNEINSVRAELVEGEVSNNALKSLNKALLTLPSNINDLLEAEESKKSEQKEAIKKVLESAKNDFETFKENKTDNSIFLLSAVNEIKSSSDLSKTTASDLINRNEALTAKEKELNEQLISALSLYESLITRLDRIDVNLNSLEESLRKELEKTIDDLNSSIADVADESLVSASSVDELKKLMDGQEADLRTIYKQINSLKEELQKKINELGDNNTGQSASLKSVLANIEKIQGNLSQGYVTNADFDGKLSEFQSQLAKSQKELDEAVKKASSVSNEGLEKANTDIQKNATDISGLQSNKADKSAVDSALASEREQTNSALNNKADKSSLDNLVVVEYQPKDTPYDSDGDGINDAIREQPTVILTPYNKYSNGN